MEKLADSSNENVAIVMNSYKNISAGFKRLFLTLYILGLAGLLFWQLSKYDLVVTFVVYIAVFSAGFWLLVGLFLWIRAGFKTKKKL